MARDSACAIRSRYSSVLRLVSSVGFEMKPTSTRTVGVVLVGERRSLVQLDERVAIAREEDVDAPLRIENRLQALRDVERDLLLEDPGLPFGARLRPSVARIEDDREGISRGTCPRIL